MATIKYENCNNEDDTALIALKEENEEPSEENKTCVYCCEDPCITVRLHDTLKALFDSQCDYKTNRQIHFYMYANLVKAILMDPG